MSEPTPPPTVQNTLEQALIKSIDGIQKTGTELVEALYQQAPEVVEQLLMWHGVEAFIQFIVAILGWAVPLITVKVTYHFYNKFVVSEWCDPFPFWLPAFFCNIVAFIAAIGTFQYINIKWLKIWLAPKVYLLEYLTDMIK
jgi:hypothetical protein